MSSSEKEGEVSSGGTEPKNVAHFFALHQIHTIAHVSNWLELSGVRTLKPKECEEEIQL